MGFWNNLFGYKKVDSEFSKEVQEAIRQQKEDDEIEQRLIEEAQKDVEEEEDSYEDMGTPCVVIMYEPPINETSGISRKVISELHCRMVPEYGSIIWVRDIATEELRSYKVVRYDYFETGDLYESSCVYVVVEPAGISEIIPHPRFDIQS